MRNHTVLIVEEDANLGQMLQEYLGHFDLRIFAEPDWNRALMILNDRNPSVSVCGISLDTSACLDWITRFREARPDIQNIILIGEPTLDFMIRALRERVWDVIVKPFRLECLYASIQGALASPPYHELISQLQGRIEDLELRYHDSLCQALTVTLAGTGQGDERIGCGQLQPEGDAITKAARL